MQTGFNIEEILQSYNSQIKDQNQKKNFDKEAKKIIKEAGAELENLSTQSPSKKSENGEEIEESPDKMGEDEEEKKEKP